MLAMEVTPAMNRRGGVRVRVFGNREKKKEAAQLGFWVFRGEPALISCENKMKVEVTQPWEPDVVYIVNCSR